MADSQRAQRTVILDVDGTLVDSNYLHVIAWSRAFARQGVTVPHARLHRHVGMGGDQLVAAAAGDEVERRAGDAIREAHDSIFLEQLIGEVPLLPGARELLDCLKGRGATVVLASSASRQEVDHYLDLLDARDVADAWTSKDDVERTKPSPDLVQAALDKAGAHTGLLIGDTVWDVEAAAKLGIDTIAVLTGGLSEGELLDAGAAAVYASAAELVEALAAGSLSSVLAA
jgi:HAD superfamily hydrolase (TIGR01509 family)